MICFPNAKINFGLNIGPEGPDCLHEIESFFIPIKLCDVLEVIECNDQNEKIVITYSGIINKIENDLCVKAYHLIDSDYNIPKVKVHLHKKIPFGAGLGGGSSDATHMLKILNNMFKLNLSQIDMLKYSKKIGSDCAFFIHNNPSHVLGKGDKINSKKLNIFNKKNIRKFKLLLVKPKHINISTNTIFDSYRKIKKKSIKRINFNDFDNVYDFKNNLFNDLEEVSFKLYPELSVIKDYLYLKKAIYSSMTGSGSCIYAIFPEGINLSDIINYFREKHFVWLEDFAL